MSKKPTGKAGHEKPAKKAGDQEAKKTGRKRRRAPAALGVLVASATSLVTGYGFWKGLFAAIVLIFAWKIADAIATVIVRTAS
jgi:hypothetical protein